jgi:hypothetical protein
MICKIVGHVFNVTSRFKRDLHIKKIVLLASVLTFLLGCTQSTDSQPTPYPADYLPTAVALTGQAMFATAAAMTPSITPTETITPTALVEEIAPSPTPTFAAGFTQFAQVQFISPGPLSSLVSPFNVQAYVASGESDRVQVDLLGEDGRVLQRILKKLDRNPKGVFQRFEISFEIRAVSETGYIRISSKDDFGRIQVVNTMPVLLYSVGTTTTNPPGNMIYERVSVDGLKEKTNFYAGQISLNGRIWPFNETPFVIELIGQDGRPISSRIINMNGIDTQPFATTLPYKVSEPTPVRLTFRQENPFWSVSDPEYGKYIYVYTVEVILNP